MARERGKEGRHGVRYDGSNVEACAGRYLLLFHLLPLAQRESVLFIPLLVEIKFGGG